jgi:D-sedoheptulose 7-phosphate isomerase
MFLDEVREVASKIDTDAVEHVARVLLETRGTGRLFILGVGGSAANAGHAVNDFRKITGIEAYAPTDNVAELTARTNDEGWPTVFVEWLKGSRLRAADTLLVLSVGGGDAAKNVSPNLVAAIDYAKKVGSRVVGIVGRDGGHTARVADACVVVPTVSAERVTPHAESFQAVIWHLLVSHPSLKQSQTKWESVACRAVFFDRDGTLTENFAPPALPAKLRIVPEAATALSRLRDAGFKLVMVTNQPDVARGFATRESVDWVNYRVSSQLPLDQVLTCYHDDGDACECRKPKPGMLVQAAAELGIDLSRSFMVGDTWRDIDAGHAAGCQTVWVHAADLPVEKMPALIGHRKPGATVCSLAEAVSWILEESK